MEELKTKAYEYAAKKHEGQYYLLNGVKKPYIVHCEGVCRHLLNNLPKNIEKRDIIAATALLHDVLEDTDASYEELVSLFGQEIADNVKALTKNENLPYEKRLEDSVKRIFITSKEAQMVKLADRYFNLKDVPSTWGYEKCMNYAKEGELIRDRLGDSNQTLKTLLDDNIKKYREEIKIKFNKD